MWDEPYFQLERFLHPPLAQQIMQKCKVNENIFRGSNSAIFVFVSLLNEGQLLLKREFQKRPFLEWRVRPSGEGNRKSQKLVPSLKMGTGKKSL